jgi:hypothetical protein
MPRNPNVKRCRQAVASCAAITPTEFPTPRSSAPRCQEHGLPRNPSVFFRGDTVAAIASTLPQQRLSDRESGATTAAAAQRPRQRRSDRDSGAATATVHRDDSAPWGDVVCQLTGGIGSAGPGYMLKCLYLNGPRAWLAVHKGEWAYLGPDSICFLCSFLAPGLYRPGRFGWRGAEAKLSRRRCRGDVCAAAATYALPRRLLRCRGDVGAIAATLAQSRRRFRCDVGL